jgi:hypothetical protein
MGDVIIGVINLIINVPQTQNLKSHHLSSIPFTKHSVCFPFRELALEMLSGSSAAAAEQSVSAIVQGASALLTVVRSVGTDDDTALVSRLQALQAEFEAQWTTVCNAAEALDEAGREVSRLPTSNTAPTPEIESLLEERQRLRTALAGRNQTIKQQIDELRQALVAIQLMNPTAQ